MARPVKKPKQFTENVQDFLNELANLDTELNDFKMKNISDYKELKSVRTDDIADLVSTENIRNNTMNSYKEFLKLKMDVMKLYGAVITAKGKVNKDEDEKTSNLGSGDKNDLYNFMDNIKQKVEKLKD